MDGFDFPLNEGMFAYGEYNDARINGFPSSVAPSTTWPYSLDNLDELDQAHDMSPQLLHQYQEDQAHASLQPHAYMSIPIPMRRPHVVSNSVPTSTRTSGLGLGYAHTMANTTGPSLLASEWQYHYPSAQQAFAASDNVLDNTFDTPYGASLQASTMNYVPFTTAITANTLAVAGAMSSSSFSPMGRPVETVLPITYLQMDMQAQLEAQAGDYVQSSLPGNSPTGSYLEVHSLSGSENEGWSTVDWPMSHHSLNSFGSLPTNAVFNPGQTLHIRTTSESSYDECSSGRSSSSYEEVPFPLYSPISEGYHTLEITQQGLSLAIPHVVTDATTVAEPEHDHARAHDDFRQVHELSPSVSSPENGSTPMRASPSNQYSTSSSVASSPSSALVRHRKSPTTSPNKTTKAVIKKGSSSSTRKEGGSEKRIGRRRGPLRPDQRQQAHEIRKLRACLRCKFLKKTCDKGDPCTGCRPSHARLWQVPCTRIDIKDIGFFLKDWTMDHGDHLSQLTSVRNIKGYSNTERLLYVTHGYGHYLPINAREIHVRDEACFNMNWMEKTVNSKRFEVPTAKLTAGTKGVSTDLISEYLDLHLDNGFEHFVDNYFEGTPFLTDMLKTAHRYWLKSESSIIRKALKLVVAYNLTLHITMVEGLSEEEAMPGSIEDEASKYFGKTMAPVMINFQIKEALGNMWRELQKDVLEELSSLYSSVYSGEKLKNWPTIFMLATILLAVWEEMQFDAHFRTPDEASVNKFCSDMETTPVGVIVGLFQAISQKLPSLLTWNTQEHGHLLGSNAAVCDALTEVSEHVTKHESYLRTRPEAKFDRNNLDCLSNKFLARLVIRATS